jgi:hypothetical protein
MKFKAMLIALAGAGLLSAPQAHAAGCLKGAVAGGIAGHYAGHHAVLGAIGGCVVGHHMASEAERKRREEANRPPAQ